MGPLEERIDRLLQRVEDERDSLERRERRVALLLERMESERELGASPVDILRELRDHSESDRIRFESQTARYDRLEALILQARVATADVAGRFTSLQLPPTPAVAINVNGHARTEKTSWPPWVSRLVSKQVRRYAPLLAAVLFGWAARHLLPLLIGH